jgi:O-antigen/teichoic acid export membrane protein
MESQASHRDWRLMHTLAARSLASIVLAIGFSAAYTTHVVDTVASISELSPSWLIARVLVGLGAVAAVWLWFRMAGDYLRHRPSQDSTAWRVALFVGLVVGALFYFWWVWRPRTSPSEKPHAV